MNTTNKKNIIQLYATEMLNAYETYKKRKAFNNLKLKKNDNAFFRKIVFWK